MTQTNSIKVLSHRLTFPALTFGLLALASGCAVQGYDASDMLTDPVAVGGQTDEEATTASGGAASSAPSSGGDGNGETVEPSGDDMLAGSGTGGNASNDELADDALAVSNPDLVGRTAEWLDHDITIERAETTTTVETNPAGEEYVSRLHSMTVKVQSRDGLEDLRGEAWELALADGMRVPPLCAPEPGAPGVMRFRYDFFHDSEQPLVGAWLERGADRDGAPLVIALDSFVAAESVSPED